MTTVNEIKIHQPHFRLPTVRGTIERRILINFRCAPDALARILPAPFRPKLVNGHGVAGICLIRLGHLRPAFLPAFAGLSSENAAHRIAIEWDDNGVGREGVFIPRRDTDAWLNQIAGGKIFPGVHHPAKFQVEETDGYFRLKMQSDDGSMFVRVSARVTNKLPDGSVFNSLEAASGFFRKGSTGWSVRPKDGAFDGLELNCDRWQMEPLEVENVESSFFEDKKLFPCDSVTFDSAFLMRNIAHEWRGLGHLISDEI